MSIVDRMQAIKTACQLAKTNDIILIAGKGHESYQEINGQRTDFDDFKIVSNLLTNLIKALINIFAVDFIVKHIQRVNFS